MLVVNQNQNYYYLSFQDTKMFNVYNAKQVQNEVLEYIKKPFSHVTLNMEGVSFIDSTALECLLNIQRNARLSNSDFRLGRVSEEVLDIIKVMQLDNVFKIMPEAAEEYSG